MGGDEVLEYRHTLLEVGDDRVFDDVRTGSSRFLRLGHKSTHTAELLDLGGGASGPGIQHHIDRVESLLVGRNLVGHDLGELVVHGRPEVDDLVVSLVVGDETVVIVVTDTGNLLVGILHEGGLLRRDEHVAEVEGDAGAECLVVSEVLDVIEELCGTGYAGVLDDIGDDLSEGLLAENLIDIRHFVRYVLVHDDAARGGLHHLSTLGKVLLVRRDADGDFRVHIDGLLVVGHDHLFRGVEPLVLSLRARTDLRDVVQTQHHILGRHRDRSAVRRVEDVL